MIVLCATVGAGDNKKEKRLECLARLSNHSLSFESSVSGYGYMLHHCVRVMLALIPLKVVEHIALSDVQIWRKPSNQLVA